MHSKLGGRVGLQQHPHLRGELPWIWGAAWGLDLFVQTGLAQLQGGVLLFRSLRLSQGGSGYSGSLWSWMLWVGSC